MSRVKNAIFVPGDLDMQTRLSEDQTHLPCEFGANLFIGSGDISYTNRKVTDTAENRTLRSSLHVVTTSDYSTYKQLSL